MELQDEECVLWTWRRKSMCCELGGWMDPEEEEYVL
jgi:hypothetical protein